MYSDAKGRHEQALVCLSKKEIVDASRGRTFHCKMAENRCFLKLVLPNLFGHLAAFNYNGKCPPYPRADVFSLILVKLGPAHGKDHTVTSFRRKRLLTVPCAPR